MEVSKSPFSKKRLYMATISSRMKAVSQETNTCNNASKLAPESSYSPEINESYKDTEEAVSETLDCRKKRIQEIMSQNYDEFNDVSNDKNIHKRRTFRTLSSQKKTKPKEYCQIEHFNPLVRQLSSCDSFLGNETSHNSASLKEKTNKKPDFDLSLKSHNENKTNILMKKKFIMQKYRVQNMKKVPMPEKTNESKKTNSLKTKNSSQNKENIDVTPIIHMKAKNKDPEITKNEESERDKWSELEDTHEAAKKLPNFKILSKNNDSKNTYSQKKIEKTVSKENAIQNYLSNVEVDDNLEIEKESNGVSDVEERSNKGGIFTSQSVNECAEEKLKNEVNVAEPENNFVSENVEISKPDPPIVENTPKKQKNTNRQKNKESKRPPDHESIMTNKLENIEKWLDNSMKQKEVLQSIQKKASDFEIKVVEKPSKDIQSKSECSETNELRKSTKSQNVEVKVEKETSRKTSSEKNQKKSGKAKKSGKLDKREKYGKIEKCDKMESTEKLTAEESNSFTFEDTCTNSKIFTFRRADDTEDSNNEKPFNTSQCKEAVKGASDSAASSEESESETVSNEESSSSDSVNRSKFQVCEITKQKPKQHALNDLYSYNRARISKPENIMNNGSQRKLKFSEIPSQKNKRFQKVDKTCKVHSNKKNQKKESENSSKKIASDLSVYSRLRNHFQYANVASNANKSKTLDYGDSETCQKTSKKSMKVSKKCDSLCELRSHELKKKFSNLKNRTKVSENNVSEDAMSDDERSDKLWVGMIKRLRKGTMTPQSSLKCLERLFMADINQQKTAQKEQQSDRVYFQKTNVSETPTNNEVSLKIKESLHKIKMGMNTPFNSELQANSEKCNSSVYSNPYRLQNDMGSFDSNICAYPSRHNLQPQQMQTSELQPLQNFHSTSLQPSSLQHPEPFYPLQMQHPSMKPPPFQQLMQEPTIPQPSHSQQQPDHSQQQQAFSQQESYSCWTLPPVPDVKLIQEPILNTYAPPMNTYYDGYSAAENLVYAPPEPKKYIPNDNESWTIIPPCPEENKWDNRWIEKDTKKSFNNNNPLNSSYVEQSLNDFKNNMPESQKSPRKTEVETNQRDQNLDIQSKKSMLSVETSVGGIYPIKKDRDSRITFSSFSRPTSISNTNLNKKVSVFSCQTAFGDQENKLTRHTSNLNNGKTRINFYEKGKVCQNENKTSESQKKIGPFEVKTNLLPTAITQFKARLSNSGSSISTIKTPDSQR